MTCKDCDKHYRKGNIWFFRWKISNIGIIACEKHAKEIMDVLREAQKQ